MFENTVKSATFPVLWEILHSVSDELEGVRARLNSQHADADDKGDHVGAMIALAQLQALNAWEPAVHGMLEDLRDTHKTETGSVPDRPRRRSR